MLYSTFKVKDLELKNRWIMLAMHTGFAEGNQLSEREFAFYEERAKGGAAAITMVLAVNEAGKLKGMHTAESLSAESLLELSRRLHEYDCKLIVQLFHCGRNESQTNHIDRPLLAPSALPSPIFKALPKAMEEDDLAKTKEAFANAASFCENTGVDAIELSASAGYLLSEFLSPTTNLRTDAYGYETNKGFTYPLGVIRAVRERIGACPIFLKVSGAQMVAGGYELEDTISFCRAAAMDIDAVTVTGGWHESPIEQLSYHVAKGAYVPFAAAIKKYTSLPVIACNRIHDEKTAQKALEMEQCDLVGTARAFLADPQFANKIAEKELFLPCQGCNRCISEVLKGNILRCAFNPEAGQEFFEHQRRKIATRKEVVVVGGGPGGIEAAKKAAERGFMTTLISEDSTLGGQLRLAGKIPNKEDLLAYLTYMEETLKNLGVQIKLGEKADADFLLQKKPYFTVIATGSRAVYPSIAGAERGILATDLLEDIVSLPSQSEDGQLVIIGGGALGLETAAYIKAQDGARRIKIVEAGPSLGQDLGSLVKPLLANLKNSEVQFMADTKAEAVEKNKVMISIGGKPFFLQADAVVFATGSEPREYAYLTLPLMDERLSYALVGDAETLGNGTDAIQSAYELFTRLYLA